MFFKIVKSTPIKEFVIRSTVELYEYQGPKEVLHSSYDIALDTQPYVKADNKDGVIHLDIDHGAIMQELSNSVAMMQLTNAVARELNGLKWQVQDEENAVQELSDQS